MSKNDVDATVPPPIPPLRKKRKSELQKTTKKNQNQNAEHNCIRKDSLPPPLPPPPLAPRTRKISIDELCSTSNSLSETVKNDYQSLPIISKETDLYNNPTELIEDSNPQDEYAQTKQLPGNNTKSNNCPFYFTFEDFQSVMSNALNVRMHITESPNELSITEITSEEVSENQSLHDSNFSIDEDQVEFRVITTNIPFEKCLNTWNDSYENDNFKTQDDSFIFDDYIDRSKRINPQKELFSTMDLLEPEVKSRSAPKVKFALDSPGKSNLPDQDLIENSKDLPAIEITHFDESHLEYTENISSSSNMPSPDESSHTFLVKACIETCPKNWNSSKDVDVALEKRKMYCSTLQGDISDWYGSVDDTIDDETGKSIHFESFTIEEVENKQKDISELDISADMRHNAFADNVLNVNDEIGCEVVATHPKVAHSNPLPESKADVMIAKSVGEVKSNMLNELLSNFGAMKLKPVRSVEHLDDEKTDDRLNAEVETSVDMCAIGSNNPVTSQCNINDNNAMTPVDVSRDRPQREVLPIPPGSVRNRINYYEIQHKNGSHFKDNHSAPVITRITQYEKQIGLERKSVDITEKHNSDADDRCTGNNLVPKHSCIKRKTSSPKAESKKSVQFNSGCAIYELQNNRDENLDKPSTNRIKKGVRKRKAPQAPNDIEEYLKTLKSEDKSHHVQTTSGELVNKFVQSGINCLIPQSEQSTCNKAYVFYCTV